jgi:peptidyl-prolyl cis-trans isomerase SurA
MKKLLMVLLLMQIACLHASSQTLFTYGSNSVDAKDFLRAYNKNNTQGSTDKAKSIRDYLDLYIKSRLKVREAYERRYDTLPQIKTEIANLRQQISENYMADPDMTAKMAKEAFERSQKDLHVAHIFISIRNTYGSIDSVAAQLKKEKILARLNKGEDFSKVARELSDDTTARMNGGDIGYITVFTLPYEFENAVYSTPIGRFSNSVSSKAGYHIFKVIDERKAVGKVKAQQILLAFPPNASEATKKQIQNRADSLYRRIIAGDNFNKLASEFSNDYVTAATGGMMPETGIGQYDPAFEKVLFSLPKDGAVSKPFLTKHGWHIVKRLSVKAVVTDPSDKAYRQELEQRIVADNRWRYSRDFIFRKVMAKPGFKKFNYDDAALWNMSDSVLDLKPMNSGWAIKATTPLFAIGDSIYNANDWVNFAHTYRYKQDGTGAKPWPQVRDEWIKYAMTNYYKEHLEDYSDDFRYQMAEFTDGNLFFEIMQQEVWNKAQNDSAALAVIYEKNRDKYQWKQSADAIMFFCSDYSTAKTVYEKLKGNPANWPKVIEEYTEKVIADSSRYEWDQIPNIGKTVPKSGMVTSPLLNTTDNTASFAYIVKVYTQPMQRSFTESRGMLINDYQNQLENAWNEALMKKYPVVIDKKVLEDISK